MFSSIYGITNCFLVPQKRAPGQVLLTEVFKHLGLDETDYFGLQYLDNKEQVVSTYTLKYQRVEHSSSCKSNFTM